MYFSNPGERANLRSYTEGLSDRKYFQRAWVRCEREDADFPLDWVFDFFLDDTQYAEKAEEYVGESLFDAAEVNAVRRLVANVDALLNSNRGRSLTDAEYVQTPEWPAVYEAAKSLHALIVANDANVTGE